jgi:DNA-binding GntR family transcriptional regulator
VSVTTAPHPADRASARTELEADYTPRYVQVARRVRARITDGTYPLHSCVPGSGALAAEFGVSRTVALHGLAVLVRAGYLRHVEAKPHQVIWDGREDDTVRAAR